MGATAWGLPHGSKDGQSAFLLSVSTVHVPCVAYMYAVCVSGLLSWALSSCVVCGHILWPEAVLWLGTL